MFKRSFNVACLRAQYFNHSIFQQLSIYCLFNYRVSSKLLKSAFNRIKKIHKSKKQKKKKKYKNFPKILFFLQNYLSDILMIWKTLRVHVYISFISFFFLLISIFYSKNNQTAIIQTKIYKNCDWIFIFLLFFPLFWKKGFGFMKILDHDQSRCQSFPKKAHY